VSSKLVLQNRNSLQGLSIENKVQLFWVSGHCAACGIEEKSAHVCPTLANLKSQIFGRPILSVSEYEMSAGSFVQFAEKSGRFETRVKQNFNKGVYICTLCPISGPRAEVVYNFTH
jgi:hypothetical protein